MYKTEEKTVGELLSLAGIRVNGNAPWDITVHDERFYRSVLSRGSLGAGEAYMDGWWDVPALDEFFARVLRARLDQQLRLSLPLVLTAAKGWLVNQQTKTRSRTVGVAHYDIGNDLYRAMLDERLIYSCGYWENAHDLDAAQEAKLDLICRKLGLKSGMRLLDIGCGWGGLLKYAAERYGITGVGITISKQQAEFAERSCSGLPIKILLQDYRDVKGQFDRLVSVGMFEHVGWRNYGTFTDVVRRSLPDDGLCLLHTIGRSKSGTGTDPWIAQYIFPNSMLPSPAQISRAVEGMFVMEDWHNFGHYYDPTLMAWFANFDRAWPALKDHYDDRFYRMWKYYLLSCAGSFRARAIQLWQVVLSPYGVPGGWQRVR